MTINYHCPRCKEIAVRQTYAYNDGSFKCPRCDYTGYEDDFDKRQVLDKDDDENSSEFD